MRLQPLPDGAATWSDADARKNFELMSARIVPGKPDDSRLLRHPLARRGRRRSASRRRQALDVEERSRMADARGMGERRDAAERREAAQR